VSQPLNEGGEPLDPLPGSVKAHECPRRDQHAAGPVSYMAWHAWAAKMAETHDSHRCPGCNLFMIWTPKSDTPWAIRTEVADVPAKHP
jgi:hypothetical protein